MGGQVYTTIVVDEQYRLAAFEHGWRVDRYNANERPRRSARTGQQRAKGVWKPLTYHPSLGSAAAALQRRYGRECGADGVEQLTARVLAFTERLAQVLGERDRDQGAGAPQSPVTGRRRG